MLLFEFFSMEKLAVVLENSYICNVFFIVLDLRLMKIGCRETTFPFLNPFVFLYSFVDI